MLLPLPSTIQGTLNTPKSISYLHNMYNVGGALVSREPMIPTHKTYIIRYEGANAVFDEDGYIKDFDGSFRCLMRTANGRLYAVVGDKLFRHAKVGSENELTFSSTAPDAPDASIDGTGDIKWSAGYTGVALATGTTCYFVTDAGTITELTDTDLPDCSDVAYLGGRYVWLAADGETIHFSEVNDAGNVDALSFFDAESRPDRNRALSVIGEDLFVFGEQSIQRFRNIGSASQPFVNVSNSIIPVGYLGGRIRLSTRTIFIGAEEGSAAGVYELSGSSITKISNSVVDEILKERFVSTGVFESAAGLKDIGEIRGQSFESYGQTVFVFNTDDFSLYARQSPQGYEWGFLSSDVEGDYSDSREWYKRPLGKVYDGVGDANYKPVFEFDYATFYGGEWLFACNDNSTGKAVGIYRKFKPESDQEFHDETYSVSDGSAVEARFTRGIYLGLRDSEDRDTVFDSLEVTHSRRTGTNYTTAVTGDANDTINLSLSFTGIDGSWSTPESIAFGALAETNRLRFSLGGGLTATNGCLQVALETDARTPFTIERLLANV